MMKQKSKSILTIAVVLSAVVLSACGAAAPAEPTQDPNAIFTQVAETVMVSMTQTSEAVPPTPMPEITATMAPTLPIAPTDANMTQPAVPTLPAGPTATIPRVGDSAKWASNNPSDGSVFKPNEHFQMTACFINDGTTEWDKTYYLQWKSGYRLCGDITYFYVGEPIEPGDKWCFTIPAVAPPDPGSYTTRWYIRTGDGNYMMEDYFPYKVEE